MEEFQYLRETDKLQKSLRRNFNFSARLQDWILNNFSKIGINWEEIKFHPSSLDKLLQLLISF